MLDAGRIFPHTGIVSRGSLPSDSPHHLRSGRTDPVAGLDHYHSGGGDLLQSREPIIGSSLHQTDPSEISEKTTTRVSNNFQSYFIQTLFFDSSGHDLSHQYQLQSPDFGMESFSVDTP